MIQEKSQEEKFPDIWRKHEEHKNRLNEIRKRYPVVTRLEDYISRKYKEAKTSDSKSYSEKCNDLAWKASRIKDNFERLMMLDFLDSGEYISEKYGWCGFQMRLGLYDNDSLKIKLQELGEFFTKKFDELMKKGPCFLEDENLSEENKKEKELIVKYIRNNRSFDGRSKLFENEAILYESYLNNLINVRGWGSNQFPNEKIKLPPSEEYSRDYSTFYDILYNFRVKIDKKVHRRKLTYKEYEHIVNTPIENLFYELTEELGLSLS